MALFHIHIFCILANNEMYEHRGQTEHTMSFIYKEVHSEVQSTSPVKSSATKLAKKWWITGLVFDKQKKSKRHD
jgi:hypothetical protein